jgi:hypothetical protein
MDDIVPVVAGLECECMGRNHVRRSAGGAGGAGEFERIEIVVRVCCLLLLMIAN